LVPLLWACDKAEHHSRRVWQSRASVTVARSNERERQRTEATKQEGSRDKIHLSKAHPSGPLSLTSPTS
jgi:hypothetical protein